MSRGIKIGIAVVGMVIVLTIAAVAAIVALFMARGIPSRRFLAVKYICRIRVL